MVTIWTSKLGRILFVLVRVVTPILIKHEHAVQRVHRTALEVDTCLSARSSSHCSCLCFRIRSGHFTSTVKFPSGFHPISHSTRSEQPDVADIPTQCLYDVHECFQYTAWESSHLHANRLCRYSSLGESTDRCHSCGWSGKEIAQVKAILHRKFQDGNEQILCVI